MRAVLDCASVRPSQCSSSFFEARGVRSVLGIASVASHCAWEVGLVGKEGGEERCEWRSVTFGFLSFPTGVFTPSRIWASVGELNSVL